MSPADRARLWPTLLGAALLALAFVASLPFHPWPGSFALKASPVLLLLLLALRRLGGVSRILLSIALLCSALGDVLLDVDRSGLFVPAMGAFLLTQVCYTALFLSAGALRKTAWPLILLILLVDLLLIPRYLAAAPELALPGALYLLALSAMAASAALSAIGGWLPLGGLLFFVSDHLIASNRLLQELPYATVMIMVTYYGAQLLITASVLYAGGAGRMARAPR